MEAHRVLLNCVGEKILWMHLQNGGTEFMFCLSVVGTQHSWKCNRKFCFWQRIVKCEPVLKRAHLSGWMFPCISECALLGRKAVLRIWSHCFSSVTHLFSLSFWDQLCVSQRLVSCSVPLALSNWISGKCFKSWLSNSSAAPAKWCFFSGLSQ